MERVATKTTTLRPASGWRPDAYDQASPALRAIIAACVALDREAVAHNNKTRGLAAAYFAEQKRVTPTDAELHAAMDAVPVPDCLRVPLNEPYAVAAGVRWSDGTDTFQPIDLPGYRTLRGDEEIEKHFGEDAESARRAVEAYDAWIKARSEAGAALHDARRKASPEYLKNDAAMEVRRREREAMAKRQKAARRALAAFDAKTPADRLAQIIALFEIEGGRITRSGNPQNIDDAFEDPEGTQLVALMFRALGEAADAHPPSHIEQPARPFHPEAAVDEDVIASAPEYARERGIDWVQPPEDEAAALRLRAAFSAAH